MIIRSGKTRLALLGTTAIGLAMSAGIALAQAPAADNNQSVEEVVVTGSHIRGVAPVGSTVVNVSTEDMQKQGASTVIDMLRDLPEVTNIGFDSTGQNSGQNLQGGGGNGNYGRTINLRGIASQDTLTLVNGMRMVPSQSGTIWDIDAIPSLLVQQIDVVADGGSATYGADAVTGTVNVIYKKPADVLQVRLNTQHMDGQTGYKADLLVGNTWNAPGLGEGGLLVAIHYDHMDPGFARNLPGVYFDNLTPYLGSAAKPLSAFGTPGNLLIGTTTYALPTGVGAAQGITLSQLSTTPALASQFTSVSQPNPDQGRWDGGFNFTQDLADWLHFNANGYAQFRRANANFSATGAQNQTISVPNTNPYSPCATAAAAASIGRATPPTTANGITCPANGTVSVQENIQGEVGSSVRNGRDKTFMVVAGLSVDLPFEWKGTLTTNLSGDHSDGLVQNTVNANTDALPAAVSGVGKPANVPFFNPFCVNSTVTACNSPITNAYITGSTDTIYTNNISETTLNFDGPIYHLPGGEVRLALGAAYENEGLDEADYNAATAALGVKIQNKDINHKNVASHYEELFVPIVGKDNAMPGIQSLEFDLANRYTAYSDFGVTDNPKIGLNYTPIDGLKIHASAGTSFRAPSIRDESPNIEQQIFIANNANATSFPSITVPAGVVSNALSTVSTTGGQPGIRPETGRTWSLGFDWAADKVGDWNLNGLVVTGNYYNIHLVNQIDQIARTKGTTVTVNDLTDYGEFDILNPTYFGAQAVVTPAAISKNPSLTRGAPLTQAQYNTIIANILADPHYSSSISPVTGPVIFFVDQRRANSGRLRTDGVDFSANYTWDMGWATADAGFVATYVANYNAQLSLTGPVLDLDNSFTYPLRMTGRLHAGLQWDGWDATLYLNYKNPYHSDPALLAAGVVAGSPFTHIHSYFPLDASISYDTANKFGPYLNNTLITLAATNVFSQRPPLVLQGNVNYDATEASQYGRVVQFTIDKKF